MKFEKTAIQYCVELTVAEFTNIMDKERDIDMHDKCEWSDNLTKVYSLCDELNTIQGIDGIDYNGHFGANIWYTNDLEYPVDHEVIQKIIEKWTK